VVAAARIAVELAMPSSCCCVGELDDQDAVLRHEADERDEPDLRVDVERRRPALGELEVQPGGPPNFKKVKMIAPNIASGTEPARMTNGSRNELNCAASTRKMRTMASPIAGRNFPPLVRSWRDSPV
jgi:hypothetical protein